MYYKDSKTSPRVKEMRRTNRRKNFLLLGVFVTGTLIIFFVALFIIRLQSFQIQKVVVSGTSLVSPKDIESKVFEKIKDNYLFFIPRSSIFFYNKNLLSQQLIEDIPRLKEISLSLEDANTLFVSVQEHRGVYLWCGFEFNELVINNTEEQCLYVDDTGYVFDNAPSFSGNIYLKFFGGSVDINNKIGSRVLSQIDFNRVTFFASGIKNLGFNIFGVEVSPDVYKFLVLRKNSNNVTTIVLKSDSQVEKILSYLKAAVITEPLVSKLKNSIHLLEYIDLRFNKKVYYKFSNEEETTSGE